MSALKIALFFVVVVGICFPGPLSSITSFVYRDFGVMGWPTAEFARDAFWKAEFPLWNPYSNCGVPFLAQWGTMVLYPPSLLYYVIPLPWGLNLFELVHLVWAGLGGWMFFRSRALSDDATLVGSTAFVFCGIGLATLTWPNYVAAYSWVPWLAMMLPAAAGGHKPIRTILAASMQMMTGAPELIILTWLFVWGLSLSTCEPSAWVRKTVRFTGLGLVVLGVCAVQLLPFIELLNLSQRVGQPAAAIRWQLPLNGLGNLVAPLLHTFKTAANTYFTDGQFFLSSVYVGLITLLLATSANLGKRRDLAAAWGAIILFVWLALGPDGYLYQCLVQIVPGMGIARFPVKFLLMVPLPLALLAAEGYDALRDLPDHARRMRIMVRNLMISGVLVGVTLLGMAKPMPYEQPSVFLTNSVIRLVLLGSAAATLLIVGPRQKKCAWIVAGLMVLDARFHLPRQNPETATSAFHGHIEPPKTAEIRQPERIFITPEAEERFLKSNLADLGNILIGQRLGQWSHLNLVERTAKVNGSATLQLQWQKEVQSEMYLSNRTDNTALLDFLAVTHQTSPTNVVEWLARPHPRPLITGDAKLRLATHSQIKTQIFATTFDPSETVWLESGLLSGAEPYTNPVTISGVEFEANRIRINIANSGAGVVVIAQSYHPGWEVSVDGKTAPLLRANFAFQAVPVPAYASVITLEFGGSSWRWGVGISALTLGCALLKGWRAWIIKKAHTD